MRVSGIVQRFLVPCPAGVHDRGHNGDPGQHGQATELAGRSPAARGTLGQDDDVLVVNTSSGLKTVEETQAILAQPRNIQPSLSALLEARG
jgi:hypothetical protein